MNQTHERLTQLQADATVFYHKARAFHWTVTGERFFSLHEQFEAIYTRWAEHIDALAEQMVINGGKPLLSLTAVAKRARIEEVEEALDARAMVETIVGDLSRLVEAINDGVRAAEKEDNRGTVNLLEGIRDQERKALWMLSALLK
ncbi:MAG: DNA starvation/stationary phase protection protein [Bryobacterales bacterium]|nr:DNA starvation/stationary phase protection protein [Bryobacterales bacterium]